MRGDIPAAALRLVCELPVRTHERTFIRHVQGSKAPPPVVVEGAEYPSVAAAARELRKSRGFVRGLLRKGKARYV